FVDARFMQLHGLKAPRQRRVFLEVFLVLAPGRCGDGTELATCESRLEQVGGISAAGLAASADQGMGFVDEKDDGFRRVLYFIDHALKTTLELALDAGTCLQQAEVEAQQ